MGTVVDFASARREALLSGIGTRSSTQHPPHTVRLAEPAEQAYWCRHFKATAERLSSIVKEVGSNPAIVQMHLYRR